MASFTFAKFRSEQSPYGFLRHTMAIERGRAKASDGYVIRHNDPKEPSGHDDQG